MTLLVGQRFFTATGHVGEGGGSQRRPAAGGREAGARAAAQGGPGWRAAGAPAEPAAVGCRTSAGVARRGTIAPRACRLEVQHNSTHTLTSEAGSPQFPAAEDGSSLTYVLYVSLTDQRPLASVCTAVRSTESLCIVTLVKSAAEWAASSSMSGTCDGIHPRREHAAHRRERRRVQDAALATSHHCRLQRLLAGWQVATARKRLLRRLLAEVRRRAAASCQAPWLSTRVLRILCLWTVDLPECVTMQCSIVYGVTLPDTVSTKDVLLRVLASPCLWCQIYQTSH